MLLIFLDYSYSLSAMTFLATCVSDSVYLFRNKELISISLDWIDNCSLVVKMLSVFVSNILKIGNILLVIPGFIILFQFIWIFVRAIRQKNMQKKNIYSEKIIREAMSSILESDGGTARKTDLKRLKDALGSKQVFYDILSSEIFDYVERFDELSNSKKNLVSQIIEFVNPIAFYKRKLHAGDAYEKAHACKMLASYGAESEIKSIEKHLKSKNKYLSYSAAMALSKLGDKNNASQFILDSHDNFRVSHRFIIQLFDNYGDDVKGLAAVVLGECDDYIKATVIKAIAKYNFREFEDIYTESLKSENPTLRVAAITALGNFADAEHEQILINAFSDKEWIVRSAAVKALGLIDTPDSLAVVSRATSDPEWWVRYNAARTLVSMTNGLYEVESILSGYDDYAADATKYTLYRDYAAAIDPTDSNS